MGASLNREWRLWVFAVILFLSWVQAQLPVMESIPEYMDFCSKRTTVKACPTPPTIDNIDLRTFVGSYYKVGTTSRYKLKSETGVICSQSSFSVDVMPPPQDQTSVVTIDVINSGAKVMGIQSVSALSKIAYAASDVCANAARMCAMLDASSKLSGALFRIASISDHISDTFPLDAHTLSRASFNINSTVAGVQTRLDALSRFVGIISRVSAELNQGLGPVDSLLRALRELASQAGEEVEELSSVAIGNLTAVRTMITQVIPQRHDPSSIEVLSEASTLIEQEIELLYSQVTRVLGLLDSIGGPLADMIVADSSSTNATASAVTTNGVAIQNPDQRGNMLFQSGQVTKPYKIIALEGLPVVGYSSMLVYSCQIDANGDPAEDLFLLSRTPDIATETVNKFLDVAMKNGIGIECDNIFVPTVQRGAACGISSH